VKFVEDAGLEREGFGELAANGVAGVVDVEFGEGAVQHGFADDEFTDKIHDGIDARGIDTERAFGNGGDRGRAGALIGRRGAWGFGGARGNLGGLRFEKITEEFVFGRLRVFGGYDADIGDYRGNLAAMGNVFDGMLAGNGGFHDFNGSGGQVVFRAQGDDRAAGVENIADQLEGGGTHGTVGIDAQGDVENVVAAEKRFGDHQALVLAPVEARGNGADDRFRCGLGAVGRLQELLD